MDIFTVEDISLASGMTLPADNTTYPVPGMVDMRQALDLVFFLYSSGDQDVTVQVVGHHRNAPHELNALVNIEDAAVTLPAGNSAGQIISIPVVFQHYFHSYLGLTIATTTGLTAGSVSAIATRREYSAELKRALAGGAMALLGNRGQVDMGQVAPLQFQPGS
jgi:hypothetical protein